MIHARWCFSISNVGSIGFHERLFQWAGNWFGFRLNKGRGMARPPYSPDFNQRERICKLSNSSNHFGVEAAHIYCMWSKYKWHVSTDVRTFMPQTESLCCSKWRLPWKCHCLVFCNGACKIFILIFTFSCFSAPLWVKLFTNFEFGQIKFSDFLSIRVQMMYNYRIPTSFIYLFSK